MDFSCIDIPDNSFCGIPPELHEEKLISLQQLIKNPQFYQTLLNHSTINKIRDRSLLSIVVTVMYELDQQLTYDSADGKLTRYLEVLDDEVNEYKYISRNRYLCKIEGMNDSTIPSLCRERNLKLKRVEDKQQKEFDQFICVMGFEDGIQLRVGERYHIIGIYQSSRFDEDSELDIKIPTNQRLYILLWRKYGFNEYCLDCNKLNPEMSIVLNNQHNELKLPFNNFNIRSKILDLFNSVIREPMNIHLLLNLITNVHCREPILIQKYSIGIIVDEVQPFIDDLKDILQLFNPFVEMINGCQSKLLLPQINAETIEYEEHSLQIGKESVIIIVANEEMNENNKEIISELIEQEVLQYKMYNQTVNIPTNCSIIFITKKEYNNDICLLCDQKIIVHNGITNVSIKKLISEWSEKEIIEAKNYINYCKHLKCIVNENFQDIVTTSFVNARKINSRIDQMTLHKWLNMASILGSSYGKTEVNYEIWEEMLRIFAVEMNTN